MMFWPILFSPLNVLLLPNDLTSIWFYLLNITVNKILGILKTYYYTQVLV